MKQLNLELGERSYPIYIGDRVMDRGDLLASHIAGREVLVVTNETVAPLYLERLCGHIEAEKCETLVLPDGERFKTLATVETIYDKLLTGRHSRATTLVALGGGVIGDMVGFAAATYQRGVKFIQVPTTLLSQVDSSVGGKTGVNHPLGKNMIGAFYQPAAVFADIGALATLPSREYGAGLAEVIKYGLIADPEFYRWLGERVAAIGARDQEVLTEIVYRCCRSKASVVESDEREAGIRAILNLGHTFGHAIETAQGYGGLLHGEGVAVGMVMGAELSRREGWLTPGEVEELRDLLAALGLPVTVPPAMTPQAFLDAMAVDKKVVDGRIRLVLLKAVGDAVVTESYNREALAATLSSFCR